ncbi:MAG: type II secretion system F family protein [bacterium]|nr:type II secretion system F family protein [bacterium]
MITSYYVFIILGFLAVVMLSEGVLLAWNSYRGPKARSIAKRLRVLSAGAPMEQEHKSIIKTRLLSTSPVLESVLLSIPRIHVLDRLLVQAGIDMTVASFLLASIGFYGVGVAALVLAGVPTALAAASAAPLVFLPLVYAMNQRTRRIKKIEEQLPDALDLIGRALRAGHAFQGAFHMVADEAPAPVCEEFKTAFDEINFGVSVQEALMNMATRVPSTDLRYFVIAVMIQRDTGGNLAELLDNISRLMRDRMKLLGTVRVLAAEGKLSAWILSLLPFALALAMTIINPGFLNILFTDPLGQRLLLGAGVLMLTGIIWLWRLTKIRV